MVMAKYGKEIDKLLTYNYQSNNEFDVVKVALIDKGYATEHWDEWKTPMGERDDTEKSKYATSIL